MSVIVASLQGRFGNQTLTYLFCRALAFRTGSELRVEPWVGDRVFNISHPRPDGRPLRRMDATEALAWAQPDFSGNFGGSTRRSGGCNDIEIRDYCQFQGAMIYTKRQAQEWLKLRPEIEEACKTERQGSDRIVCHLRRGDYLPLGYVVVSAQSHMIAMDYFGFDRIRADYLSEETPTQLAELPKDLGFVEDFYRMMKAPTLFRANSSFSWLAGLLSDGAVFSPVIEGLEGGKEHTCRVVPGNWPRFANLSFVENLHIAP